MGIISRQGDVGIPSQRAAEKNAAKISDLQPIVCVQQPTGDAVERQRVSKKDVVHTTAAIHLDLQTRVFTAAKLINAIGGNCRRAPEFVWRHSLRKLRVDPENRLGRIQRAFDI